MHRRPLRAAALLAASTLPLGLHAITAEARAGAQPRQPTAAAATATTTTSSTQPSSTSTTTTTTTTTSSPTPSSQTPQVQGGPTPHQRAIAAPHRPDKRRADRAGGLTLAVSSRRRARIAADPADTISDFKFSPATITIRVGDTITWTNVGPAPHTATANDGSFDTGTLKKGQSASHTFTKAGTFAYICSIHPFMHGTVIVQASSTPSGGSGSGAGSGASAGGGSGSSTGASGSGGSSGAAPAATATAGTTSAPALPNTGTDLETTMLVATLLISAGVMLRRRFRSS